MAWKEGDRISNYLLETRLGVGSFGEVWRARHHVFDDHVAIKVPTNPQYVRNLQHEGVAVHGIRHPNIVRALDLDPYGDPPYLVMELVDGPSMRQVIDQYGKNIPLAAVEQMLIGVLTALEVAHGQNLVHRDLKPANILLDHPLEDIASIRAQSVKVTDFGLGKVGGATASTMMQSGSLSAKEADGIAGTPAYMAPEQRDGRNSDARNSDGRNSDARNSDARCDLFACGVILFELLTGTRPHDHELPSDIRSDVPPRFDDCFRKSYARVELRFESAVAMLEALRDGAGTAAREEIRETYGSPPPPPPRPVTDTVTTGRRCPACAFGVESDDHFCIRCGQQLVESVPRCPNADCRAFVHTNDRFCVFCGTSLQVLQ